MENIVHVVDKYNPNRFHVFSLSDGGVLMYNQALVVDGSIGEVIREKWSRWSDVGYDDQIDGEQAFGIRKFLEASVPLMKRIKKAKAHAKKLSLEECKLSFGRGWSVRYMLNTSPEVAYEGDGPITKKKLKEALAMVPEGEKAWVEGGYGGCDSFQDYEHFGVDVIEYWEVEFDASDLKRGS